MATKILFIQEEQVDMTKQREEMLMLSEMKQRKEALAQEIQDQEARITALRRTLGYSRKPAA